jgi:hypothetical protein
LARGKDQSASWLKEFNEEMPRSEA